MIDGKSVLAIIPARGGSKGVPRKNIRYLCGKPLIAWTIEEAKKSRYIDRLILSSEDSEIMEVAKTWGCEVPFARPIELAQDETPGIAPVLHAINALSKRYDYVVLLQATSPLRTVEDIDGCIEFCIHNKAKSCVSLNESEQSPYWMYKISGDYFIHNIMKTEEVPVRRQDISPIYTLNGAIYIAECQWIKKERSFLSKQTVGYVMPNLRSLDIDSELDLHSAEYILRKSIASPDCE